MRRKRKIRVIPDYIHASTDDVCQFCKTRPAVGEYAYKLGKESLIERLCAECVLVENAKPTVTPVREESKPCVTIFIDECTNRVYVG